jgi:hypothetical protein
MYLRFGWRVIVEALKNDSLSEITIPAAEDIAVYNKLLELCIPFFQMCAP